MNIGFVLVSYQLPRQVLRLVNTLNRLYGDPPIACHHDTSQSSIDTTMFPANVSFVSPTTRTGWGKWSVIKATLDALRLLYDKADPDWYFLLSPSDYPIAPADQVRSEIAASGIDALIDYREPGMDPETAARRFGERNPALGHFEAPGNRDILHGRYRGAELWLPRLRLSGPHSPRIGRHTVHLPFDTPNHPFTDDFKCYCGDHWHGASRAAAMALLNPTPRELAFHRYMHRRAVPEESFYQTMLCNRPELKIQRNNRRFAEWHGGGAHPAMLTSDDLDAIMASGAHFARKFAPDDPALDRLDEILFSQRSLPIAEKATHDIP